MSAYYTTNSSVAYYCKTQNFCVDPLFHEFNILCKIHEINRAANIQYP